MSEIALDTFVSWKPSQSEAGFDFYPAPANVRRISGRTKVTLGNVPLPNGIPYPEDALTMLYGFKDSLEELSRQHQRADEFGMSLVKVSVKLDVAELIAGSINPENVTKTRFLRLRMANVELAQQILDAVNRLSAERYGKKAEIFERILAAGARPDLLCDAIRAMPLLRHINSVAYAVPDGSAGGRQIATVFSTDFTSMNFRGEGAFDIEVPVLD